MINDDALPFVRKGELSVPDQGQKDLGCVKDFEFPLGIFIFQGVESVRARGKDAFRPDLPETRHVLLYDLREETGFPHPPDFIAAAGLFIPEDSEIQPRPGKKKDKGPRDILDTRIKRRGAPHEINIRGLLAFG